MGPTLCPAGSQAGRPRQAGPARQAGRHHTCARNHRLGLLLPPQARPPLLLGHQLQQLVLQQAKGDAQGGPQRCPKHQAAQGGHPRLHAAVHYTGGSGGREEGQQGSRAGSLVVSYRLERKQCCAQPLVPEASADLEEAGWWACFQRRGP